MGSNFSRIIIDLCISCSYSTVMEDEKLTSPVCALIMHALTALMSAGPTYTQCELMGKIMDCRSPKIKEYAEVCTMYSIGLLLRIASFGKVRSNSRIDSWLGCTKCM